MRIGRPPEFDKDLAIGQAMEVFWSKGYESTSLQDLLQATDLSKSSLYQAFGSKQDLFVCCLNHYLDQAVERWMERLRQLDSGRRFIEEIFQELALGTGGLGERGCLLWNTAMEFGQHDPMISRLVKQGYARMCKVLLAAIDRAQQEGEIPREASAAELADYLMSSMSGVRSLLKGGMDRQRAQSVARVVLRSLG